MAIKATNNNLKLLEGIFKQGGYQVRYEKGNFKSGYCIIKQQRVIVVNQYYPLEGKISCLTEILQSVDWQFEGLGEKEEQLYQALIQAKRDLFSVNEEKKS